MKTRYQPTQISGYSIDKKTGAIVNMRDGELEIYKQQVRKHKENQNLMEKLSGMENRIDDLYVMLSKMLEKL